MTWLNKVPKADFDGNDRSSVPFCLLWGVICVVICVGICVVETGENLRSGETTNPHYVRGQKLQHWLGRTHSFAVSMSPAECRFWSDENVVKWAQIMWKQRFPFVFDQFRHPKHTKSLRKRWLPMPNVQNRRPVMDFHGNQKFRLSCSRVMFYSTTDLLNQWDTFDSNKHRAIVQCLTEGSKFR